jgi:acetyl-CoA carboxylase carboxyltransferase component
MWRFLFTLFQSVTGEEVTHEELGGAKTHTATSGENLFSIVSHITMY